MVQISSLGLQVWVSHNVFNRRGSRFKIPMLQNLQSFLKENTDLNYAQYEQSHWRLYHIEPFGEEKSENPKFHNYFLEPCHVVLGQY